MKATAAGNVGMATAGPSAGEGFSRPGWVLPWHCPGAGGPGQYQVLGVGVDVLGRDRLRRDLLDDGGAFVRRTYTQAERRQAFGREDPAAYLAGRFCAKEAVFKALNANSQQARLIEIEVIADDNGLPQVRLHGALSSRAATRGIRHVFVSLTSETHHILAFAVAVGDPSTERP